MHRDIQHAGMALDLPSMYMGRLYWFLHKTEVFSQWKPHTEPITLLPRWSQITLMLKNITEILLRQHFKQLCFLHPLTLFQFLFVPEPISASLCTRGCKILKSMDMQREISLQGIMRQRWCYDYSAKLPLPAHQIMLDLKDTVLVSSQQHVINHMHPLDMITNNLTFRVGLSGFFCSHKLVEFCCVCMMRDKVVRSMVSELFRPPQCAYFVTLWLIKSHHKTSISPMSTF